MHDIISMKDIAKQLNDWTYTDYYYRLMLIARSVYEWEGLPNGINEKWIERYLFNYGSCVFYKDKTRGFMVAKGTPSGTLNYYDEPTLVTPFGTGYMGEPLVNYDECIVIQNNDILLPTSPTIQLYAYRLAELSRTIDVNVSAQKTPYVVLCSDKQKLSFKRVFNSINDNEVAVFGAKDLDIDTIKALDIKAPIVFDKLEIQKHNVWNEAMTFLGVNNANQDKRERLVASEVGANDEQIDASANVWLKARQDACDRINALFGLNISVKKRCMPTPTLDGMEDMEGGNEDD